MSEVPVYVVANIVIQDPETYKKYEKGFFPILKKYEGTVSYTHLTLPTSRSV